jgi:hypothetical protein
MRLVSGEVGFSKREASRQHGYSTKLQEKVGQLVLPAPSAMSNPILHTCDALLSQIPVAAFTS